MQANPVLWTAATIRKRSVRGDSVSAYMRRYLGRMVVVLTLLMPLLIVFTYQMTPRREQRQLVQIATVPVASAETLGAASQTVATRPLGRSESDATVVSAALAPVIVLDRQG
jgi:hypothetical protein